MKKISVVIAIAVGTAAVTPLACDDFDSTGEPTADGGQESAVPDSSAPGAEGSVNDAGVDAPQTVACGGEKCNLPNEVCCVFWGNQQPVKFCADGVCPTLAPDGGNDPALRTVVSCDDPTDCASGNVCCAASTGNCSDSALSVIECRAAVACASCEVDAVVGIGRHACRPAVATDCTGGTACTGTFNPSSRQWDDYRFCK